MKAVFETSDYESLKAYVDEMKAKRPDNLSETDYMEQVLMDALTNLSQTEAELVVQEINSGIKDFNREYNSKIDGDQSFDNILRQTIDKYQMDEGTAIKYLASVIVVLRSQKDAAIKSDQEINDDIIKLISGLETSQESINNLLEEVKTELQNIEILSLDEKMAEMVAGTELNQSSLNAINEIKEYPLYLAVAAYIAGQKGELELSEEYTNPRTLGAGIASGVKSMELTADLMEGKIDSSMWVKGIKIALGVAIVLAISYLALNIIAAVTLGLAIGTFILLGDSIAAIICASSLALGFAIWTVSHLVNDFGNIIPLYIEWFNKSVAWVAAFVPKARERLVDIYNSIREKVYSLVQNIKQKEPQETLTEDSVTPKPIVTPV